MRDTVSNKQLYEAIMEVHGKIDYLVDNRISPLERAVERIKTYLLVAGAVIPFVVTAVINYVSKRVP